MFDDQFFSFSGPLVVCKIQQPFVDVGVRVAQCTIVVGSKSNPHVDVVIAKNDQDFVLVKFERLRLCRRP